jgi:galactokinase
VIAGARLAAAGVSGPALTDATRLLTLSSAALGRAPEFAWWVPGRIEVLGKHTDYAGGRVLNCATDLGLVVCAARNEVQRLRVVSGKERIDLPLSAAATAQGGWGTYVATVARRLARHFPPLALGADISIAANLPPAAGMSSSSAFIIALHHALVAVNQLESRADYRAAIQTPEDLVQYLGCHENGAAFRHLGGDAGVGTAGGSQDHAAVMCSQSGRLSDWSFNPLARLEAVAWPQRLGLHVLVSGVAAEKAAAAQGHFNRVSARARAATAAWNRASGRSDPHLGAALAAGSAQELLAAMPDDDLRRRAGQFIAESQDIVPGAVAALGRNDLAAFAALVARSQRLAESGLENQVAETVDLVALAIDQGATAASAFGAGFGGAVWAAFSDDQGPPAWLAAYRNRHPALASAASLHLIHPGPGCTALHGD